VSEGMFASRSQTLNPEAASTGERAPGIHTLRCGRGYWTEAASEAGALSRLTSQAYPSPISHHLATIMASYSFWELGVLLLVPALSSWDAGG
jgi:hypothetical protein